MNEWKRLSVRLGAEEEGDLVLEIAPWMEESVWRWVVESAALSYYSRDSRSQQYDTIRLREIERRLRIQLDWSLHRSVSSLRETCQENGWVYLNLLDYLLTETSDDDAKGLDEILRESGSAWTVAPAEPPTAFSLQQRIDEEVAEALELTISQASSNHLREAKHSIYGLNPNPKHSYLEAVAAVEAAATPTISPKNKQTSLGTLIRDMNAAPDKWQFAIGGDVQPVIRMMELLWQGGDGRHGTPDPDSAKTFTQEEAEAALHLAATLVHWFTSGEIIRTAAS